MLQEKEARKLRDIEGRRERRRKAMKARYDRRRAEQAASVTARAQQRAQQPAYMTPPVYQTRGRSYSVGNRSPARNPTRARADSMPGQTKKAKKTWMQRLFGRKSTPKQQKVPGYVRP